jgi:hypothetical protein
VSQYNPVIYKAVLLDSIDSQHSDALVRLDLPDDFFVPAARAIYMRGVDGGPSWDQLSGYKKAVLLRQARAAYEAFHA